MSPVQERSNFIGKQIPAEVRILCKHLKRLDVKIFSQIVNGKHYAYACFKSSNFKSSNLPWLHSAAKAILTWYN